jgi:hypothetical protein
MHYLKLVIYIAIPILILSLIGIVNFQCSRIDSIMKQNEAHQNDLSKARDSIQFLSQEMERADKFSRELVRAIITANLQHRARMDHIEKAASEDPAVPPFLAQPIPSAIVCALRPASCGVPEDNPPQSYD